MGVVVSSSHVVSSAPSSSGGGLLTPAPGPAWDPSYGRQFSMNFSNVGPSHGVQLFMNCSSVGVSHGVQSFRNRLLQCGSSTGSQVLPADLPQCGLLSPWVHRSCQEPAPVRAPHRVTASSGHPPAPAWGPPRAAGGSLLPPRGLHRLQGHSLPHHGLQGNLCSGAWSTSCPSFCTDRGLCRVAALTYSSLSGCSCCHRVTFMPS